MHAARFSQAYDLKGAVYKGASKAALRMNGVQINQPALIKEFFDRNQFPWRIAWPDAEYDHDLIFA